MIIKKKHNNLTDNTQGADIIPQEEQPVLAPEQDQSDENEIDIFDLDNIDFKQRQERRKGDRRRGFRRIDDRNLISRAREEANAIKEAAAKEGNKRAQLALDSFVYNVAGTLGKYITLLKGVDAITFTAGIGENSADTRKQICEYLEFMGVKIDDSKNNTRGEEIEISTPDSKIKVFVVPTNEELMIAKDTYNLVKYL